MLGLGDGSRIDIERDPRIGMTQKLLRRFEVNAGCSQNCRERMTEAVPADSIVLYPCPFQCGPDDFSTMYLAITAVSR